MEGKSKNLAVSKAGHDKGKVYTVFEIKDGFAYLIDGKKYDSGNPKKKNIKHIIPLKVNYQEILHQYGKEEKREEFRKEDIALALKLYTKEKDLNRG